MFALTSVNPALARSLRQCVKSLGTVTPVSHRMSTPQTFDPGLSTWGHRRDPRPERSALRCAKRRVWEVPVRQVGKVGRRPQLRFLKRQLVLPVSMISQWWVRRSSMAVVILASPNT